MIVFTKRGSFNSYEHEMLKVSYWDQSMSVVRRVLCVLRRQLTTPPILLGQF